MKLAGIASFALAFAAQRDPSNMSHRENLSVSIRPYVHSKDFEQVKHICRNVYGGTDYLPSEAADLEKDPTCSFLALTKKPHSDSPDETVLAVANLRELDPQTGWLEAVRTNEEFRGQGWATHLIKNMLETTASKEKGYKRVLSMTIEINLVMQRVFDRLGMTHDSTIRMSDVAAISEVPGYRIKGDNVPCQNLLDALNITSLVPKEAKDTQMWQPVSDRDVLEQNLNRLTCTGKMPGLWKLMSPATTPMLQESIEQGLAFALETPGKDGVEAVMALVRDPQNPELKSPWVLCVAGSAELHLYSALWHACFSTDVQEKMKQGMDAKHQLPESKSDVGLVVVFDDTIPVSEGLAAKLPLRRDKAIVYSADLT